MARVTFVKKARKDYPEAGIKKDESYFWWKFQYGSKMRSKIRPKQSQLTQSEFLSRYYSIQESIEGFTVESVQSDTEFMIGELEDMRDECQEKLDNMPDHLRDCSSSGETLSERIDGFEGWISELENIDWDRLNDNELEEAVQEEHGEEGDAKEKAEWLEEKRLEVFELIIDEITDNDPGL